LEVAIFLEIKSDQELMSMFEKQTKTKMVQMFFAYLIPLNHMISKNKGGSPNYSFQIKSKDKNLN
jgi:hypothetical protein